MIRVHHTSTAADVALKYFNFGEEVLKCYDHIQFEKLADGVSSAAVTEPQPGTVDTNQNAKQEKLKYNNQVLKSLHDGVDRYALMLCCDTMLI